MLVIDRFEGDFAVCEDENGEMKNIPIPMLPENAKEGSIIVMINNSYVVDENETKNRLERIKKLQDSLWQ